MYVHTATVCLHASRTISLGKSGDAHVGIAYGFHFVDVITVDAAIENLIKHVQKCNHLKQKKTSTKKENSAPMRTRKARNCTITITRVLTLALIYTILLTIVRFCRHVARIWPRGRISGVSFLQRASYLKGHPLYREPPLY